MIIGNGDIASVLKDREDRIFFASGVSNSQETRESEYKREVELLLKQDKLRHIVYFGSLAIFYTDTRYAQHKKDMEELVKEKFKHWTIIRLGNITWGKNQNTLINYFKRKIRKGDQIEIRDTYRYIVSKDEFLHWVNLIPDWNCELNITGRLLTVKQILKEYVYPSLNR